MQKTIKGKRYNTETAKFLAVWDNGKGPDDSAYIEEQLYRTRSDNFFIYGRGGSSSIYGRSEKITPLTAEQAQQWGKEKLNNSEYTALFEKLSKPRVKIKITADISQSCKDALEKIKNESGKSNGEIIEELILNRFL